MLFAWPAVEGRIIHLYELDPTHAASPQSNISVTPRASLAPQPSRASLPYCALGDLAPAAVLLELDPTHSHSL